MPPEAKRSAANNTTSTLLSNIHTTSKTFRPNSDLFQVTATHTKHPQYAMSSVKYSYTNDADRHEAHVENLGYPYVNRIELGS
jgi:hypothetical protein